MHTLYYTPLLLTNLFAPPPRLRNSYSSAPRYRSVTDSRLSGGAACAGGAAAAPSSTTTTRTTGSGCDDQQQQQYYMMMAPSSQSAPGEHRATRRATPAFGDLHVSQAGGGGSGNASLLEPCILRTTMQTHRLADFGASYAITDDEC